MPRFVVVSKSTQEAEFLPLEDLIAAHLSMLFPGMAVVEHHIFRVTRNADLEVEEDRDEDLLQALERELARRRFGPAVRLEVAEDIDDEVLSLLTSEIDVAARRRRTGAGPARPVLAVAALRRRPPGVEGPAVRPGDPSPLRRGRNTQVACSPRSATAMCWCTTLTSPSPRACSGSSSKRPPIRTSSPSSRRCIAPSGDSPIVDALIDAAEAGKQVVALVEIKARFDEQANIKWARALERAGCHVVYGVVGPEDALQDSARRAAGRRNHSPLRARRHGQLQPQDCAHCTRTSACSRRTRRSAPT